jgi:hypothetical protein
MVLDDLGHEPGHRAARAGDQMHHPFAAGLAVERRGCGARAPLA